MRSELPSGRTSATGWEERIELKPDVLGGKPVVKGTRLAVEFVVELLADGWTEDAILTGYPLNA